MRGAGEHPSSLPWYVTGVIDPEEAGRVKDHLADCAGCRREVERLASLQASFRRHRGSPHPSPTDLVAFAKGEIQGEPGRLERVRRHVDQCAACRDDLQALAAPGGLPAEGTGARGRRTRAWWVGAAALVVILLGGGLLWTRYSPAAGAVTMMPPRRGGELSASLTGKGPWSLTIVLPFDAPPGAYSARVEKADGTPVLALPAALVRAEDGTASATLPPLPRPGLYRMVLTSREESAAAPYYYAFSLGEEPGGGR